MPDRDGVCLPGEHPLSPDEILNGVFGESPELCTFCEIAAGRAPAEMLDEAWGHLVIRPLNPVTDGHLLVIPRYHVADARISSPTTAAAMGYAADYAARNLWRNGQREDFNLITSAGPAATQTVPHLHVHIVPRRPGDGLLLPWSPR